jgi:hypothetical protein
MASFVSLHQQQTLFLINVETVQAVVPKRDGGPGAEIMFSDETLLGADETVEEIERRL